MDNFGLNISIMDGEAEHPINTIFSRELIYLLDPDYYKAAMKYDKKITFGIDPIYESVAGFKEFLSDYIKYYKTSVKVIISSLTIATNAHKLNTASRFKADIYKIELDKLTILKDLKINDSVSSMLRECFMKSTHSYDFISALYQINPNIILNLCLCIDKYINDKKLDLDILRCVSVFVEHFNPDKYETKREIVEFLSDRVRLSKVYTTNADIKININNNNLALMSPVGYPIHSSYKHVVFKYYEYTIDMKFE